MESKQKAAVLEDEKQDWSPAEPTNEPPAPPGRSGSRTRDHCDYLLDSIDAQLSQLQAQGPNTRIQGSSDNGMTSLKGTGDASVAADVGGCPGGRKSDASWREDPSSREEEEHAWGRPENLPSSEGDWNKSDSVGTEDFAATFKEALVDPRWSSDGEDDAFDVRVLSGDSGPLGAPAGPCSAHSEHERFKEASQKELGWASADGSEEPPSLGIRSRRRSLESLGGKVSLLSRKRCNETPGTVGSTRGSSAWKETLGHRPLGSEEEPVGLDTGSCGESVFLDPQRGRAGSKDCLEWVQDPFRTSNSPLLIEDLEPSQPLQTAAEVVTPRTAVAASEASVRPSGQTHRERHPSDWAETLLDVAGLCALKAAWDSCMLFSASEVGRRPIPPCCLDPRIGCDTEKVHRGVLGAEAGGPRGSQEPLRPASDGGTKHRDLRARSSPCAGGCDGALGQMESGSFRTGCHKAKRGLIEGCEDFLRGQRVAGAPVKSFDDVTIDSDLDSVRTESVQEHLCRAVGYQQVPSDGTEEPRAPQSDSPPRLAQTSVCPGRRYFGHSDTGTEGEDEEERAPFWRSSRAGRRVPSRAADPGRKGAKSQKASPGGVWPGAARPAEDFVTSLEKLEDSIMQLQQDLESEEEKLSQKKVQLREADVSLRSTLQQKQHAALELQTLRGALEERQREARRLEVHLSENRSRADEARADLALLGHKREACLRELPLLQQELSALRRQCSQYGVVQAEVSRLVAEREELKTQVCRLEDSLSSLKLQIRRCKAELTSMHEAAGVRNEQLQEVARAASQLDGRIQGLEQRISALQKVLAEKELELLRLRETVAALEAEKEARDSALERLEEERRRQLEALRQEALREKETELVRLREELHREKQQALREFAEKAEQAKSGALQEQASALQKDLETLRKTVQDQDAELLRQRQDMERRVRELRQDGEEMVQSSLLQEQKRWEADARTALQMQREVLEEQHRRSRTNLQEALEQERRVSLASQDKNADLHQRIQELESQASSLRSEKREAMKELQALLQEEKVGALKRLREELEQEWEQERDRMRARLQQMEEDLRGLRAEQSKTSLQERELQARAEWADGSLATGVVLACQQLQDLLPKPAGVPSCPRTLHGWALQALQEVSEDTRRYLQDLQHEVETQKRYVLQIQREKERELRQQQERLRLQHQSSLEALKDQLAQEHMEDIAALQRSLVKEAGVGGGSMLQQQLQEKDSELRAIQRNMAHWKDETASQLAHKLKEELRKRLSKDKPPDYCGNLDTPGSEARPFSAGCSEHLHPHPVGRPWVGTAPLSIQCRFSTPKPLHHLQSRVRDLRAESALCYSSSLGDLTGAQGDLGRACRSKRHLTSDLSTSQLHDGSSRK